MSVSSQRPYNEVVIRVPANMKQKVIVTICPLDQEMERLSLGPSRTQLKPKPKKPKQRRPMSMTLDSPMPPRSEIAERNYDDDHIGYRRRMTLEELDRELDEFMGLNDD